MRYQADPFSPTRGETYKVHGVIGNGGTFDGALITDASAVGWTATVSKDGGAFSASTNAVVTTNIGAKGVVSLVLTATEMDADTILVSFDHNTSSYTEPIVIVRTASDDSGGGGSGLTQSDLISGEEHLPLSNATIGDLLKAMYFWLRKYKNRRGN